MSPTTMRSDLEALIAEWQEAAANRMRSAKAYKCRSMDGERSGLIKGALALQQAAKQVQAVLDAHTPALDFVASPERKSTP